MGVVSLSFLGFFIALSLPYSGITSGSTSRSCKITILLLGSTGDLARRYIWPALYENHVQLKSRSDESCKNYSLLIFGASRREVTDEDTTLSRALSNIQCPSPIDLDDQNSRPEGDCVNMLQNFKNSVQFVKLSTETDYQNIALTIKNWYEGSELFEVGRVAYLSVPPSAYMSIIEYIDTFLRPAGWLRVVIEKPFGRDLSSAKELATSVSMYLKETEVYRIDHYLGKFGVQQIQRFRKLNYDKLQPIWTKDSIQYVEIAMKETLDVRGRSAFYDSYGVIRDIHQNHLTEILSLLLSDTAEPPNNLQGEKLKVLSKIFSPRLHHAVLGQYVDYQGHLYEDKVHTGSEFSLTPTYASVALYSSDPKWRGVPFILTSGKQLKERSAYVKIVFKDTAFYDSNEEIGCRPEIMFVIHHETFKKPGVLLSHHFSRLGLNHDSTFAEWIEREHVESSCKLTFLQPKGNVNTNSYVSLLAAIIEGKKEYFIETETLLESWRIWTSLLEEIDLSQPKMISYSTNSLESLEFKIQETKLITQAVSDNIDELLLPELSKFSADLNSTDMEMFGCKTVTANKYELSSLLAVDVHQTAMHSVKVRGSFHIALPGGESPILMLDCLSLEYRYSFPWEHTHVWQTDERCVLPWTENSNIRRLSDHLISSVPIPYRNVHPMPVALQHELCGDDDNGVTMYERELMDRLVDKQLDYVLIGVGIDGHIASLFPTTALRRTPRGGKLVQTVKLDSSYDVSIKYRMTLGYDAILSARRIGIIITGQSKRNILNRIENCIENGMETETTDDCNENGMETETTDDCNENGMETETTDDCNDLPIVRLLQSAKKEQLTLYVDSKLL